MKLQLLWLLLVTSQAQSGELFHYQGKAWSEKDLPPRSQLEVYELRRKRLEGYLNVADHLIWELEVKRLAKKSGKSFEAAERLLLKTDKPSDKELKEWFTKNRAKFPSSFGFEMPKPEIKKYLRIEREDNRKRELIRELRDDGELKLAVEKPKVPTFKIDTFGAPIRGNAKGKLRIVQFGDFACPHCQEAYKPIKELVEKYSDEVRFEFVDFYISPFVSKRLALAGYCAAKQNRFWDFHDLAYENQDKYLWQGDTKLGEELNLDMKSYKKCLSSDSAVKTIEKRIAEGERLGVDGTPAIFVGGQPLGLFSKEALESRIRKLL